MGASSSSTRLLRLERPEQARYRLVSRIATGGMAEVFLALMPGSCGSSKPVVIKRLWPELARDPDHLEMFLDEVRLTLGLHHPNVIHGYESGSDGDHPFLAMEYLDGQSFKHILDKMRGDGGLSLPLSLKIICDLLAGLEYVHGLTDLTGKPLRIVHCDVSPQNVFVTCDGAVKLIDFGIARSAMSQSTPHPRDTRGRVAYMAPEQLLGETLDCRADLFSVGVMLWEAAVGQRLWQGLTDGEIMQKLLSREPPPRLPRGRGFPPGLATICARALALDPDQRYASASEFQSDLATVSTGSMPAQTRLLGSLVTRVFASSRALARTMIQQSLPGDGTPAKTPIPAQPTRELAAQPEASPSSADEARPSGTSLATIHDDITQVGPHPGKHPPRMRRVLGFASIVVLLGLASAAVARGHAFPIRAPAEAVPVGQAGGGAHEKGDPIRATQVIAQETCPAPSVVEPAPVLAPAVTIKAARSWRSSEHGRRHHAGRANSSVSNGEVVLTRAPDFFDVPLPRTLPVRSARDIDRESPYGP